MSFSFPALPPYAQVFQYEADGDAIMTDAPIYRGTRRMRSESGDTAETGDSRPSKRSRSSSDEASAAPAPASAAVAAAIPACPPAPKKAAAAVLNPEDDDDDVVRDLAERMAEVVLEGEPRDAAPPAPLGAAGAPLEAAGPPPGGEYIPAPAREHDGPYGGGAALGAGAGAGPGADAAAAPLHAPVDWCMSVTCPDLALSLDMRHPRVVLNFLRFVKSYNEVAPQGEEIKLPPIELPETFLIFDHESVRHPPPEFVDDVAELCHLVNLYSCRCPHCDNSYPDEDDDQDDDEGYGGGYDRYNRDRNMY